MIKRFLFFVLVFGKGYVAYSAPDNDSLFRMLKNIIEESPKYDAQKIVGIDQLKTSLNALGTNDLPAQYKIISALYEEYKTFNYDSAFLYARKLQERSYQLQSPVLIEDSKVKLSFILVSAGLFKDALDTLHSVSLSVVSDSIKAEYYSLMGRYYYDLSDYNNDKYFTPAYFKIGNLYIDSSLLYYQPLSFEYAYYNGLKDFKTGEKIKPAAEFLDILKRPNLSYHQKALVESTLSGIYKGMKETDKEKGMFLLAAIDDIKSSTKETTATLYLAQIYFADGDLKAAFLCVEKAIQDAIYYGARQRQVQLSSVLPIIEVAQVNAVEAQKKLLILYSSIVTLLLLGLIILFIIINKQNKKLKIIQQAIIEANQKEQEINHKLSIANSKLSEVNSKLSEANQIKEEYNEQLQEMNHKLLESNKIKEEYIGYYFNIDTKFLARIEKLVNSLNKRLTDRKWDEMKLILHSIDLKKEKEDLLKNFDKVFLRLFPRFVSQVNTLFKDEDKIVLKDDQLLNNDLRIFALIRLGITENEKIAEILDYSINTIYAKKTKIRNKTTVSNDEFEKKIKEITTIHL